MNLNGKQTERFKVLGAESRVRIIEMLKASGPLCVNEMSSRLGITASAVSQHLKALRYAGLVTAERNGSWMHYEVDPTALAQCNELLAQVCRCGCVDEEGNCCAETDIDDDGQAALKRREQQLLEELEQVRSRLREIEIGGE